MIPKTINSIIIYITSLNVILGSTSVWLHSFGNDMSNLLAFFVAVAGIVISYYTVVHLKEKIIETKLSNEYKRLEIQEKKNENK